MVRYLQMGQYRSSYIATENVQTLFHELSLSFSLMNYFLILILTLNFTRDPRVGIGAAAVKLVHSVDTGTFVDTR